MNTTTLAVSAKSPATLHVLEKFDRVLLDCDGRQVECSTRAAIAELRRTERTLADILLVDFDQVRRANNPPSRQCEQVRDVLLSSGLPDPILAAAKGR